MIGRHLLADMRGVAPDHLVNRALLERVLGQAAKAAGLSPVAPPLVHVFAGGGMTAVLLLAESHISLHSYPEYGYLALDVFTCGQSDPALALDAFRSALNPAGESVEIVARGRGVS